MGFFDFLYQILSWFGIYESMNGKILLLGLDNAGKTTCLYYLKNGNISQHAPTQYSNKERIDVGSSCTFEAIDLGGHELARSAWRNYFMGINGIVFMVSAVEKDRFREASRELSRLMVDEDLKNVPIVVMGNKIDDRRAVGEQELRMALNLDGLTTGKSHRPVDPHLRPIELFMTSIKMSCGIRESLEWLAYQIKARN